MITGKITGKTTVIGGDARQRALHEHLCSLGVQSTLFGFSPIDTEQLKRAAAQSECIILPLPLSLDGKTLNADKRFIDIDIALLPELFTPEQKIFAGMPSSAAVKLFEEKNLKLTDYYKDEALLIYNARLTAQGLLLMLLENTDCSLDTLSVLITGYGRVGHATAMLLKNAGAKVHVCVRSAASQAAAETDGVKSLRYSELKGCIFAFDVIINTVAQTVIDSQLLRRIPESCLLLEAASSPYGFDMQTARKTGKKIMLCPGLPGKYTPVSAGIAIADTILRNIGE